jgi:GlpG protein
MIKFGELADKKMAEKFQKKLKGRELEIAVEEFSLGPQNSIIYELFCREEDLPVIFEHYRVLLGHPPAPKVDKEWEQISSIPMGIWTKLIIIFCSIIFLFTLQDPKSPILNLFFISSLGEEGFHDVLAGEYWRLLSPVFLHFGFMHIIFNMMWMKDLGSLFEQTKGPRNYLFFILITGIGSNLGQYLLTQNPRFGGMSGVIYALLGFVWIHAHFHAEFQFKLPKNVVVMMVGWYFLCLTGLMGPIANMAHGVGLGMGMIIGLFPLVKKDFFKQLKFFSLALFFCFGTAIIESYLR